MRKIAPILGICALILAGMAMLAFHWNSRPPSELKNYRGLAGASSNDVLSVKMQRMAEQAALDAWGRFHIRAPIRVGSLAEFDRYLDAISKSSWFKNFSLKDKRAEAVIAGAFVGEAIRRTHGGFWQEKADIPGAEPFVLNVNGAQIWPINWCFKRLMNGPEDNIYDKYALYILKRTNGYSGDITIWTNNGHGFQEGSNITIK